MELKEHQKVGVEIIKRKMSHLLIADEMGLGKTAMTISAIKILVFLGLSFARQASRQTGAKRLKCGRMWTLFPMTRTDNFMLPIMNALVR